MQLYGYWRSTAAYRRSATSRVLRRMVEDAAG
jgi:hypothetical protein